MGRFAEACSRAVRCVLLAGLVVVTAVSSAEVWRAPASAAQPQSGKKVPVPRGFVPIEVRGPGAPLWRKWIDLDADGKLDLVVVSGSASIPAAADENKVDALLSYLKVTPAFLDRRRILVFRQSASALVLWGEPLPLPGDASAVDLADLERDGSAEILFVAGNRVSAFSLAEGGEGYATEPRTLCDVESFLGYTRAFIPRARLAAELDKDGRAALVLSTSRGVEIRGVNVRQGGIVTRGDVAAPGERGAPARDESTKRTSWDLEPAVVLRGGFRSLSFEDDEVFLTELPVRVVDVDGDGAADVLFTGAAEIAAFRGSGDGRFVSEPVKVRFPPSTPAGRLISVAVEDVDGDERLDAVLTRIPWDAEDGEAPPAETEPAESAEAPQNPARNAEPRPADGARALVRLEIHRGRPGLAFAPAPDLSVDIPRTRKREAAFVTLQKIDADGRIDLIVTRFWASLWQVARVMVTKKASVRISFETQLQGENGRFASPRGKPFETTVLVDLKRGLSGLPSQPRGDFDGDGRTDLLEFTDAPAANAHIATHDGAFPAKAAWSVPLPRAPEDRALVDIEDLDGDGRSDLAFFTPEAEGFVVTLLRSGS